MAQLKKYGGTQSNSGASISGSGLSGLLKSKPSDRPDDFKDYVRKANHSEFAPDPSQPATSGPRMSQESLCQLGVRIKQLGQLVPIKAKRNDNPDIDAKYLIEDGERRWRAIGLTPELTEIEFILNTDPVASVDVLINQIAVNNEREQPICADNADAYARVVAELKDSRGLNQKQVAVELGLPETDLTKYLAIAKATQDIKDLSFDDIIQDLECIYLLGSLKKKDKDGLIFAKTINAIREGNYPGTARSYVRKVLASLKRGGEPKDDKPKALKCHTVKELKLLSSKDGNKTIEVQLGAKKMQLSFTQDQLLSLID